MSTPSKSKNGGGSKKPSPPSATAEKFFGSEVDIKGIQGVLNPPQKLAEGEKMPEPAEIPDKKPSKDASAVQELEEKLKGVKKDVGSRAKDQIFDRAAAGTSGAIKKTSKSESPSKKTSEIYKTGNVEEETKKDGKKISTASTGGPGNQANAMRILVLAQKGDWTACESTLKALERSAMDEGGPKNPLANISDNVTGNTPLMYAAMENRTLLIERMIELGCDIHAKNKEHYTTLHLASMYSREDTVKLLLSKKADPTAAGGPKNQSCVHLVCSRPTSHALQILRALLFTAPKNIRLKPDLDGNIPLFAAIEAGNLHVCRELLMQETEAQVKYTKPPLKDTALHLASRRKDNELVKLFIEAGAGVDVQNAEGQTVVHISALNGDENMIRTLYLARANATIQDNEDRTPLHLAAERGHTSTVEFLADKFKASVFDRTKDGSTLMHIAALNGHPDTAMVLFKKGVPLLMPNRNGARGIHTAAMKGHVAVINTLLAKGENVDAVTNDNYTALHLAVEAGKPAVVESVLGHGAQVHIRGGPIGEAPLHISARIEEARGEKCTKMLLKSGADTNLKMTDGRTPLHIAAESGSIAVLKLLLAHDANALNPDMNGETPLHKACRKCHYPAVKELLAHAKKQNKDNEKKIEQYVRQANHDGEQAIHLAGKIKKNVLHFPKEDAMIVKLLMEHGSDVMAQTKESRETVFHYIASEGNVDVLKELLSHLHGGQIQLAVNKQSSTGWSPLIVASGKGHLEVVKIILENNGRVDVFDHEGRSALHLAAEFGSIEVCEALLNKNAFINSKAKTGWTSLHNAAMKGYAALVEYLIKSHNATIDSLTMQKQTPLHLAAQYGQLAVCDLLLTLGASLDSTDDFGQKPIHLAALSNKPEVVKLFLKQRANLVSVSTKDGSTCAHIAAAQGSLSVIQELMSHDLNVVLNSRNKVTDSTPLHIATEGGHFDVVKKLLDNGASASDENKAGLTPIHIAAKFGHTELIDKFHKSNVNLRQLSRKTGLTPLHIAAYYGKEDTVRELLTHVPASVKSEQPTNPNYAIERSLATESNLTALHLAAFSGSENVVRTLLNSSGVDVEGASSPAGYIPLHFASLKGHVGVVGLLLSRSTSLLKIADKKGQTCLHVASSSGHFEMVQVLLGQGSDFTCADKEGWTPLHCAAQAGHLDVVKLLTESGAATTAETTNGRIPLWFAAAENNLKVVTYLITQEHDAYKLLEDRRFVYNLMACGKKSNNAPTEDFILASPAPVDVAAKISAVFRELSFKEKDRAMDLTDASVFAEEMCNELVSISSAMEKPATILQATDKQGAPFLDVLINCELKQVIANSAVQTYTTELWKGGCSEWPGYRMFLLFVGFVVIPPMWFVFSLPLKNKYNRTPFVKFGCYLTSHIYFMIIQCIVACTPLYPIYRESLFPYWNEWMLMIWVSGLLLGELISPQDRSGLGAIKLVIILLQLITIIVHLITFAFDVSYWPLLMYIRNQLIGLSFLCSCIQILDFLSFHHLFGPWAIIISSLVVDTLKFLVVLMIFEVGFTMMFLTMNQPYYLLVGLSDDPVQRTKEGLEVNQNDPLNKLNRPPNALDAFERLFYALFGLTKPEDLRMIPENLEPWTEEFFKLIFGLYLLMAAIVLINLLIAMMSDTYQRVQYGKNVKKVKALMKKRKNMKVKDFQEQMRALTNGKQQSDIEWKYGFAKLIRNYHTTNASPPPINLVTTWTEYIRQALGKKAKKKDKYKRMKQQEIKEMKKKGGKGKVAPFTDALSSTEAGGTAALGSSSSFRDKTVLENCVLWSGIVNRYKKLKADIPDKK